MTGRVAGRRILVTGGASGIGLAASALFLREGARVAILDRDRESATEAARQLGGEASAIVADVAATDQVDRAVAEAEARLGGLDGIVNSAGIDLLRPLAETSDVEWGRLMEVNLSGPMRVCRAALPALRRAGGGTIVNVASGAALVPLMHRTAYCAAKAGLVMFGKALAIELAPDKIRVNAICPGAVETPLFRTSFEDDAQLERIKERYLLHRIATPEEIAAAILFLVGEDSSYMTGAAIAVDGGRSFH